MAGATSGRVDLPGRADDAVTGVAIDSRLVDPGDLFVALPGERTDGHDHVEQAVAAGAAAVMASREDVGGIGVPVIRVHDTAASLTALAASGHRDLAEAGCRTVAVTGSAGKTTTKDLIAHVLRRHGRHPDSVAAAAGSYNNEIGLPLTVARAAARREPPAFLVLEMGARGVGHIARLCRIAPPDVSVVLMVGSAHAELFGDLTTTAAAKGEIVAALGATGVAVLNADDPAVAAMATRTRARVVTFGRAPDADVRAVDVGVDESARARFALEAGGSRAEVRLPLSGDHQVGNALAAAAVALVLGMDAGPVAAALGEPAGISPHRMQVGQAGGVTVVDDAYNANPESMAAALRALATMGRGRRTWAVLGPMRELGPTSAEEHDRIGRLAVRLNVSRLVAVGEEARGMHLAARLEGSWDGESVWLPAAAAAAALLREEVAPGDVVLFKASNAECLWRVAEDLLASLGGDEEAARS